MGRDAVGVPLVRHVRVVNSDKTRALYQGGIGQSSSCQAMKTSLEVVSALFINPDGCSRLRSIVAYCQRANFHHLEKFSGRFIYDHSNQEMSLREALLSGLDRFFGFLTDIFRHRRGDECGLFDP